MLWVRKFLLLSLLLNLSHSVYAIDLLAVCEERYGDWWRKDAPHPVEISVTWAVPHYTGTQICFNCWGRFVKPDGTLSGMGASSTCAGLQAPEPKTDCKKSGVDGNPIRLNDGVKVEQVTDIASPAGSSLSWSRTYTSKDGDWVFSHPAFKKNNGAFDNGTSSGVTTNPTFVWVTQSVILPDGAEAVWLKTKNGDDPADIRIVNRSKTYWVEPGEFGIDVVSDIYGNTYHYSSNGQLNSNANSKREPIQSIYSDGLLVELQDNYGRSLKLYYSGANVNFVQASWGEVVHYIYDDQNRLVKVGHGTDRLAAPLGFTYTQYVYENSQYPRALTGIIDATGARYATWTYNVWGQAIESYHGDKKDYVSISYDLTRGITTVTNGFGKKTVYKYVEISDVGKQISHVQGIASPNCQMDNVYQSYLANGQLQTQTDKKGIVTLYERDTRDRVTKQTRGLRWPTSTPRSGVSVQTNDLIVPANPSELEVIETCWHPQFSLATRIIEATTVTQSTYSATGDLLTKTVSPRPQGIVTCDSVVQ